MVTYLPGLGDELAPALSQIGGAITKVLDPDKEFRELLKLSIAQDPKVLKTLADISINNPNLFGMLGADPKTVEAIRATGPSLEAQKEKKLGEKQLDVEEGKLQLEETEITGLIDAIKNAQASGNFEALNQNALYRKYTGQTKNQARITSAQADITEAEAGVAPLKAETEKMGLELQRKNLLKLMSLPELQNPVNLSGLIDSFSNGTVDPTLMQQMASTPGMMEALDWAARFKLGREEALIRKAAESDALERAKIIAARNKYDQTGVGSTESWLVYDSPERSVLIEQALAKPPADRTLLETDLLAINERQLATQAQDRQLRVSQFSSNFSRLLDTYREQSETGAKEQHISPTLQAIQASLDANLDLLGGQRIIVYPERSGDKFKEGLFTPGKGKVRANGRLIFSTESGIVVPQQMVQSGIVPKLQDNRQQNESRAGITPSDRNFEVTRQAAQAEFDLWNEAKGTSDEVSFDAYLAWLRTQSPPIAAEFEKLRPAR